MYLHVNFECSLESFFYFPNLRPFLLSGGWMDIFYDKILFAGFFLVLCFFFSCLFFFFLTHLLSLTWCVKFQSV